MFSQAFVILFRKGEGAPTSLPPPPPPVLVSGNVNGRLSCLTCFGAQMQKACAFQDVSNLVSNIFAIFFLPCCC